MNEFARHVIAIMIGCIVGFIGGFQGTAGGFYIAILLLITGVAKTHRIAAGTTLLSVVFPISLGAVYEYWKAGDVDVNISLTIALFYTMFAWFGAMVNIDIDEKYSILSLAISLAFTAIYFFYMFAHHK